MKKADIGLIGLGVMGQNLALNFASKEWKVVVWNRTVPGKEENVVDNFIANRARGKGIIGSNELTDFVETLKTPRVILLMVQAGPAVDDLIDRLSPLLDKGDIIIDGGNSYYEDTERRVKELYDKGMYFGGCLAWSVHHARRGAGSMAGYSTDAEKYCGKSRGRYSVLRVGRSRWCRSLCEDGAQWHRIWGYAADSRDLFRHEAVAGVEE